MKQYAPSENEINNAIHKLALRAAYIHAELKTKDAFDEYLKQYEFLKKYFVNLCETKYSNV